MVSWIVRSGFLCSQVAAGRQEGESRDLFTYLDYIPTETAPVLHEAGASLETPPDREIFLIIVIKQQLQSTHFQAALVFSCP